MITAKYKEYIPFQMSSKYMQIILSPPPNIIWFQQRDYQRVIIHLFNLLIFFSIDITIYLMCIWSPLMLVFGIRWWMITLQKLDLFCRSLSRFFLWSNGNIKQDKKITIKREINDQEKNKKGDSKPAQVHFLQHCFQFFTWMGGQIFAWTLSYSKP